jgi:hypothetical protein
MRQNYSAWKDLVSATCKILLQIVQSSRASSDSAEGKLVVSSDT